MFRPTELTFRSWCSVVLCIGLAYSGVGCATPRYDGGSTRIPIPQELPDHPRLFLPSDDIKSIRHQAETDPWAAGIIDRIVQSAEGWDPARLEELKSGVRHHGFCRPARDLALAYQFRGDRRFAKEAAQILVGYADLAPSLSHGGYAGLLTSSTLQEADVITDLCWAYDLIVPSGVLTNQERRRIENDLFRRSGWEGGHLCHHLNSDNWRTRAIGVLAATGFATGDRKLMEEAINGVYDPDRRAYLYGFAQQIAHSMNSDGVLWESQIGYTYFTLRTLCWVAEIARNSGVDLWQTKLPGLQAKPARAWKWYFGDAGPRSLRDAIDALFYRAFPNMSVSAMGDSNTHEISAPVRMFGAAYRRTHDPKYAWLVTRQRKKQNEDNKNPKVSGGGIWHLIYAVRDLPAGHFSFEDDADIGVSGRHRHGCSLLPIGGYAVMRGNGDDVQATALDFRYGPYGTGHSHADKLSLTLYGLNKILAPDAGSWGYGNGMQLTWAKQTIAHNTVTVDEISQYPQADADTIWASPAPWYPSVGELVFFHAGDEFKAVRATDDTSYLETVLDRTLILLNPFVIDVYHVICPEETQIDWAWHAYGKADSKTALQEQDGPINEKKGYVHFKDVRSSEFKEPWDVTWRFGDRSLRMLQLGETGTVHLLASEPTLDEPRTAALARRKARKTVFITVFEPFRQESKLVGLRRTDNGSDGCITLVLEHAGGMDTVTMPLRPGKAHLSCGDVSGQGFAAWCRHSAKGKLVASDIARNVKPDALSSSRTAP